MEPISISLSMDLHEAAGAVSKFVTEQKEALESSLPRSVDKAKSKLDELIAKYEVVYATMDKDKQKIQELSNKRDQASGADKKRLDDEINGLKRITANREIEILKIQEKKARLEEMVSLSTAGSDLEKAAINAATNARLIEINALKDQARAQAGVNANVEEGSNKLGAYFGRFLGITGVLAGMRLVEQAIDAQRERLEQATAAAERLRDVSGGQFNTAKSFFNEFGLTQGPDQDKAQAVLNKIASDFNVPQETVAQAAGGVAPVLRANGITDIHSDRFKSLVGNAALVANRGINPTALGDFLSNQLQGNPSLTGEQFNQQTSNLLASTQGSSLRANALLQIYQEDRPRFQAAGFSLQDVAKVFVKLQQGGMSPTEIPTVTRQAFHALDRMVGLSPEEQEQLIEEFGEAGVPGMNRFVQDALKRRGQIDIRAVAEYLGTLSPDQRAAAARVIGGPRGAVALNAIAGFSSINLPTGNSTPIPSSATALRQIEQERARAETAAANPVQSGSSYFTEALKQEQDQLTAHPNRYPTGVDPNGTFRSVLKPLAYLYSLGTDSRQVAGANVFGRRLIRLARLREDIAAGRIKASASDIKSLDQELGELSAQIDDERINPSEAVQALANGSFGKKTRAGVLSGLKTDDDVSSFLQTHINYRGFDSNSLKDNHAGKIMGDSEDIERRILRPASTQPTTQPTSQIIYNNRNVIYGSGYDSIGGVAESYNRLG
jgi:hypothetical protein